MLRSIIIIGLTTLALACGGKGKGTEQPKHGKNRG